MTPSQEMAIYLFHSKFVNRYTQEIKVKWGTNHAYQISIIFLKNKTYLFCHNVGRILREWTETCV